jgi:hypothetical protein
MNTAQAGSRSISVSSNTNRFSLACGGGVGGGIGGGSHGGECQSTQLVRRLREAQEPCCQGVQKFALGNQAGEQASSEARLYGQLYGEDLLRDDAQDLEVGSGAATARWSGLSDVTSSAGWVG